MYIYIYRERDIYIYIYNYTSIIPDNIIYNILIIHTSVRARAGKSQLCVYLLTHSKSTFRKGGCSGNRV